MRKKQKKKIIDIVVLLEQAHEEMKTKLQSLEIVEGMELLENCQNAAVAIGNYIEQYETIEVKTISVLEVYCEQTYIMYEMLRRLEIGDICDEMDKLNDLLTKIKYSVQNDIGVKKEVVFFPYKASMWDALESVWKAACRDPECDAYVVPIPYFERMADGSFGKMYYEGDLYPEYVPVTDYKKFDFKEHVPDMIYIHNPYDDYNRVTSVHPAFYSRCLKKYTDMLVYIPYFVMDEKKAKQKSEVYALMPGVLEADRVIVQSENVRLAYINAISKVYHIEDKDRKMLEKKILGIGSPKFDLIGLHEKGFYVMPKEWREMIGDRKVILYNTHLSLLMPVYSERFLRKLKEVFEVFRNRDDVVLWWRPHPLMISTAKAMNPEVIGEYTKLVKEFCEGKWGIYDDSQDLERAIAISDAYYGSQSSVAVLYQQTGKPVLFHSIDITEEDV